jgi:type I restriction enzyme M protein
LRADYIIANPPFNDSDWSGELLRTDGRWQYGPPPSGNANYAWIQHFLYHLNPTGQAGFVMAKGALTSKSSGEGEIRKALIEARLVDCIVNLPAKLFLNTQIPASLWFLRRGKTHRRDEILFIDARNLGELINRRTKVLNDEDIEKITQTYHKWSNEDDGYEDIKGFCKSATVADVAALDYVLTPGRYVGLEDSEDDFDFAERFASLQAELKTQMEEESKLNARIIDNLKKIVVGA